MPNAMKISTTPFKTVIDDIDQENHEWFAGAIVLFRAPDEFDEVTEDPFRIKQSAFYAESKRSELAQALRDYADQIEYVGKP